LQQVQLRQLADSSGHHDSERTTLQTATSILLIYLLCLLCLLCLLRPFLLLLCLLFVVCFLQLLFVRRSSPTACAAAVATERLALWLRPWGIGLAAAVPAGSAWWQPLLMWSQAGSPPRH
jgi:hypothetical protein